MFRPFRPPGHGGSDAPPRWIIELEALPQYKLLDNLAKKHNASVDDALEEFTALAAAAKTSDVKAPLGVFPWNTWQSLIEIAKRTVPEKQTKMVEFVIQLEKKRMDDAETGEQMRHEGELLWTGLPALGYTVADAWQEFDPKDPKATHYQHDRWENMIALLAQLSAASRANYTSSEVTDVDFSPLATHAFHQAFEESSPTDPIIRTACMWLIYAPTRLWANIQHKRVFNPNHNELVLTMEMWNIWAEGLRKAKQSCRPETCPLVMSAIAKMEIAQGESHVEGAQP
ncbi:hypothetical protein PLICBS_008041 [Purpureocillium lilacinum]|uniref:uncharacterized protein n=1 Tax=Purpureocillium lilacinum TaxID=33203 RepID=UPI00208CCB3D|nr:hypothetical protein PLICBS_008041 [Purpureocillium lilacinum]